MSTKFTLQWKEPTITERLAAVVARLEVVVGKLDDTISALIKSLGQMTDRNLSEARMFLKAVKDLVSFLVAECNQSTVMVST